MMALTSCSAGLTGGGIITIPTCEPAGFDYTELEATQLRTPLLSNM
jgi:hypothetical protein